jgi:hypothetical protein
MAKLRDFPGYPQHSFRNSAENRVFCGKFLSQFVPSLVKALYDRFTRNIASIAPEIDAPEIEHA